jgi:hypothetical protein
MLFFKKKPTKPACLTVFLHEGAKTAEFDRHWADHPDVIRYLAVGPDEGNSYLRLLRHVEVPKEKYQAIYRELRGWPDVRRVDGQSYLWTQEDVERMLGMLRAPRGARRSFLARLLFGG